MIPLSLTAIHALLICVPFSLFAIVSFWKWPRLWLHSLPPDIAELAGPKTEVEKKQTKYILILYLLILPGLSILSAISLSHFGGINLSFQGALMHIYGIWIVVHIWDFVVIDCGSALIIDPDFPPIPGTEGAKGYRDYGFHFRMMLKAIVMSSLFAVPGAIVVSILF